jgi:hypothetical protein
VLGRLRFGLLLSALFLFRLGFGLASDFWTEDERHIYLIGLKSYATGAWPYFGPDVVWSHSQIPGAMQGLLVGLPFRVWPAPEAPYLLLNLLSFGSLIFFAWYVSMRLPELPRWIVYVWTLTAPWVLHFSTHVINTSYILPAAVVFFVGYFDALPGLRAGLLPLPLCYAMMGAAIGGLMQVHMSWVLLPLYVAALLLVALPCDRWRLVGCTAAFGAAAAATGCTLVPTLLRYGASASGGTQRNLVLHLVEPQRLLVIVAQFLSFASFEISRFVEISLSRRLVFFERHLWLLPPVLFAALVGLVQPLVMLGLLFKRATPWPHWRQLRTLVVATPLVVYAAYFLSVKEPLAHAFYVTWPIAMLFAFHCAALLEVPRRWPRATAAFLACGIVFHAGFALAEAPVRSLYRDRALVNLALQSRQYRLLGERREALGQPDPWLDPPPLSDAFRGGFAREDVKVVRSAWSRAARGRVSVFSVTIENTSPAIAYGDIEYTTRYLDAGGAPIKYGSGVIKDILQPQQTRTWETVVDGMADPNAASADLVVVGGGKYMPIAAARIAPRQAVAP